MGKRMKIAIALLVWSLLLTGCSAEPSSTQSVAELYRSAAEELVAAEDFPGALAVLDEGIANTGDANLRQYAEEVQALQAEAESVSELPEEDEALEKSPEEPEPMEEDTQDSFNLLPYLGSWATEDFSYADGGMILSISGEAEHFSFSVSLIQSPPSNRIAEASWTIEADAVNPLTWHVEEDGWGNTAAVTLRFQENAVICDITEHASKTGEASLWGLYDGSYLLHRYEEQPVSAEELLSPASGRKTSDFLAELGLDEASFRLQCQPVYDVTQGEFLCLNALQTDPVSYVGKACYIAQDIPSGTMKPLTVVSQQISSDGYPCYEIEGDILLWDVRDAPTDPAVALGDVIYGYLLFGGTQSLDGNQYLSFFLLSME